MIKSLLLKDKPPPWDALLSQPLLANPLFWDNAGKVLGLRTRLALGKMDNGHVAYVRTWIQFQQMSQEDCFAHLQSVHGAKIMTASILTIYFSFSTTFQPMQEHLWFGYFMDESMGMETLSQLTCS